VKSNSLPGSRVEHGYFLKAFTDRQQQRQTERVAVEAVLERRRQQIQHRQAREQVEEARGRSIPLGDGPRVRARRLGRVRPCGAFAGTKLVVRPSLPAFLARVRPPASAPLPASGSRPAQNRSTP